MSDSMFQQPSQPAPPVVDLPTDPEVTPEDMRAAAEEWNNDTDLAKSLKAEMIEKGRPLRLRDFAHLWARQRISRFLKDHGVDPDRCVGATKDRQGFVRLNFGQFDKLVEEVARSAMKPR